MNRGLEKCWPQLSAQPMCGSTRSSEKDKVKSFSGTQKWKEFVASQSAFLGGSVVMSLPMDDLGDAGDLSSISGSRRSPGGGNGDPIQNPCLENLMDRGAWWATIHGVTKSHIPSSD